MNKWLKLFLFGLLIWLIPFVVSFFIWDIEASAPTISLSWFNAIMAFSFAIGFSIAACFYFRNIGENPVKAGWIAGIVWYLMLIILDLIVLVAIFKMAISDFFPLLVTYLNVLAISAAIGYAIKHN